MKQNAMTEQAKLQRRDAFIAAARRRFLQQQCLPAVADIAHDTGLAKGTIYRYFRSKEEIFIAMLQADFSHLFGELAKVITSLPGDTEHAASAFARSYTEQVQKLPTLLPLAAMLSAVLERNLPPEVLKQFKQLLAGALQQLGQLLASRISRLNNAAGSTLLLHTYALTLGLWQTLQYPLPVQQLLQQTPELHNLQRDFATELTAAIRQLWLGALR